MEVLFLEVAGTGGVRFEVGGDEDVAALAGRPRSGADGAEVVDVAGAEAELFDEFGLGELGWCEGLAFRGALGELQGVFAGGVAVLGDDVEAVVLDGG